MIDHSGHDHPATPAGRSKCRRSLNGDKPKREGATPRVLSLDDEEKRPAEKSRCCYNCGIRQIEWFGTIPLTGQKLFTCEKCKYLIKNAHDLKAVEV
jgi:hypothetical protein